MTLTKINHHPSADMLFSYSAGTLPHSQALCVATHLEFCASCRQAHRRNNAIGGKLVDDLPAPRVSEDLKDRILGMLDQRPRPEGDSSTEAGGAASASDSAAVSEVPRPLRRLVPRGFDDLSWGPVSLGARISALFDDGAKVNLLRIKPGAKVAHHSHMGDEYTVIVKGSFSDEDGLYTAGDFLLRNPKEEHSPVATRDGECICLTAQEGPLQFTGKLFRLLNPWLRKQAIA